MWSCNAKSKHATSYLRALQPRLPKCFKKPDELEQDELETMLLKLVFAVWTAHDADRCALVRTFVRTDAQALRVLSAKVTSELGGSPNRGHETPSPVMTSHTEISISSWTAFAQRSHKIVEEVASPLQTTEADREDYVKMSASTDFWDYPGQPSIPGTVETGEELVTDRFSETYSWSGNSLEPFMDSVRRTKSGNLHTKHLHKDGRTVMIPKDDSVTLYIHPTLSTLE